MIFGRSSLCVLVVFSCFRCWSTCWQPLLICYCGFWRVWLTHLYSRWSNWIGRCSKAYRLLLFAILMTAPLIIPSRPLIVSCILPSLHLSGVLSGQVYRLIILRPTNRWKGLSGFSRLIAEMYDNGLELITASISASAAMSSSNEKWALPIILCRQRLFDLTMRSNIPPHHGARSLLKSHSVSSSARQWNSWRQPWYTLLRLWRFCRCPR